MTTELTFQRNRSRSLLTDIEATQIGSRVVTGSITSEGNPERRTLVVHGLRRLEQLLRTGWGLEECIRKSSFQVPFDVTMEEPGAGIVGEDPHRHRASWWNHSSVSP